MVETLLPVQRARVQSRSHTPCSTAKTHNPPYTTNKPPANKRAFGLADQSSSQVLGRSFHREVGLTAVNNRLKRKERKKKKLPHFRTLHCYVPKNSCSKYQLCNCYMVPGDLGVCTVATLVPLGAHSQVRVSIFPLLARGIGDQEAGPWGLRCVFVFGVRPLPKPHELSAESWEGGGCVSGPRGKRTCRRMECWDQRS